MFLPHGVSLMNIALKHMTKYMFTVNAPAGFFTSRVLIMWNFLIWSFTNGLQRGLCTISLQTSSLLSVSAL